jgi:hypothetical protein
VKNSEALEEVTVALSMEELLVKVEISTRGCTHYINHIMHPQRVSGNAER